MNLAGRNEYASSNPQRPLPASAEQRLKELDMKLLAPPEAFGIYVETVQTGNLLFVSGILPTEAEERDLSGVGAELDVEAGARQLTCCRLADVRRC